jgi:hypothetical protein
MNPELKKILLIRLRNRAILFVAGMALVASGWNRSGWPGNVLVIGGVTIALIAFLAILNLLLIWHELKKKIEEEKTGIQQPDSYITWPGWFNRWAIFIIYILIFTGISFGAARHENDFGGLTFLIHSLLAGLLVGYGLFRLLSLYFLSWSDHKNKKIEIAFYIILTTVFLFVSLGPVINQYWAETTTECTTFVIEPPYRKRLPKEKYIKVRTGNQSERFEPPGSILRRLNTGDSLITLCIRQGILGYKFVNEFRIPERLKTNPGNP